MSSVLHTDRSWFRKHPSTNYRLRDPAPGELESIIRHAVPAAGPEFDAGIALPLPDDRKWMVFVIKAGSDTLVRMVTMRPRDEAEFGSANTFAMATLTVGSRVMIDHIRA